MTRNPSVAENSSTQSLPVRASKTEPELNIDPHAQKAFGAFKNDVEYGEVVRKSKPAVASHAGLSGPALVCTENLIPVDDVKESPKLAE